MERSWQNCLQIIYDHDQKKLSLLNTIIAIKNYYYNIDTLEQIDKERGQTIDGEMYPHEIKCVLQPTSQWNSISGGYTSTTYI